MAPSSWSHIIINTASTVAVLFVAFSLAFSLAAASSSSSSQQRNNLQSRRTTFAACIDDSDCQKMIGDNADKYSCFLYLCYPWKDESLVPPTEKKRKLCRRKTECAAPKEECYRHPDRRTVPKGVCLNKVDYCEKSNECPPGHGCCGGNCCEEKYFQEFKKLPCVSHLGCQDLNLGKYCCPQKNGTADICCDENPNPTPPPPPATVTGGSSDSAQKGFVSLLMAAAFYALLRL